MYIHVHLYLPTTQYWVTLSTHTQDFITAFQVYHLLKIGNRPISIYMNFQFLFIKGESALGFSFEVRALTEMEIWIYENSLKWRKFRVKEATYGPGQLVDTTCLGPLIQCHTLQYKCNACNMCGYQLILYRENILKVRLVQLIRRHNHHLLTTLTPTLCQMALGAGVCIYRWWHVCSTWQPVVYRHALHYVIVTRGM